MADHFNFTVVTPEEVLFEGEVVKVIAPGIYQDIAILPDHTPLYAQLIKGNLVIHLDRKKVQSIPIDGGVVRVKRNQASVIVGFGEEKFSPKAKPQSPAISTKQP